MIARLSHRTIWRKKPAPSAARPPVCVGTPLRMQWRGYSGGSRQSSPKKSTSLKVLAGLGLTSLVLYNTNDTFHDSVKHTALTAKRLGVVVVATMRCFRLYLVTLSKDYATQKERHDALSETHQKAANITLRALEANGGIYIKLGQHITALTYLLPPEWTNTMIPLQDQCPRSSMEEIEELFVKDLGRPLTDVFSEFSPDPVGVASLAQVHIARLKNGEKVAVKVQHPSLAEFVPLDVYLTQKVFSLMRRVFPEYPLTWLGDELQNSIFVELDFTNEAYNAQRTSAYFKNHQKETALKVPDIKSANKRILIMEYVAGARLDDISFMKQHNINTAEVSACLSHLFNTMIFTPNVGLHCDPHGGNLAIRPVKRKNGHNFEIVLYDHGLYRDIPLQMKRDYSHFWLAVLDNDVPRMKEYAEKFAGIKGHQKFKIFAAAITGRPPDTAMNYDIRTTRSAQEVEDMQAQLHSTEGAIEDLMYILSSMPRIVLLILKTNDLTRALDENLKNPLGPERTFLILAKYCAQAVYEEQAEQAQQTYGRFSLSTFLYQIKAWFAYQKRVGSLFVYDLWMLFHRAT